VTLVAAELANLPKEDPHPGKHPSGARDSLHDSEHQGDCALAGRDAVQAVVDPRARTECRTRSQRELIDELAAAAGVDPLELRLRNLKDPRGVECLERLANLANWTPRTARRAQSGDVGERRGLSYIKYELVRTYVGVVADVEVNRKTGKVSVKKFYCGTRLRADHQSRTA